MKSFQLRSFVFQFVSIALVWLGFASFAYGGVVSTADVLAATERAAQVERIDVLLARQDVREQLLAHGVDPGDVTERLAGLSDAEIALLHDGIEEQVAGGDALGIIGAVFLVLIILELVGVIDIFKKT
jgi:hypothetical protein